MRKRLIVIGLVILIILMGLLIYMGREKEVIISERLVEIKETEELDSIDSTDIDYDEVFEIECPDEGQ